MRPGLRPVLLLLAVAASASPAFAAWPNSPFTNLPVSTATNHQHNAVSVSDGAGGVLIAWQDNRTGTYDIYAQHVLASGVVDPAWPANGRAVCAAANNQQVPAITSDGAGGAIVSWYDYRDGVSADVYAQRVLASGTVDPAWPVDGRALCIVTGEQTGTTIASDGAGGAIVAWQDVRGANFDVYAQRVLASGAVDPAWPANGRALCTATANQSGPVIQRDGAGGAIVAWSDTRNGSADIFAQRVLASGAVDPAWPADGRGVCTATSTQSSARLAPDGAGGVLVTWQDFRGGNYDIYVHHLLGSGATDTAWPADGRLLCSSADTQTGPAIVSDGAGGAIVAWQDNRTLNYDIYAHHVLASGIVDPAWPVDGRALCTLSESQIIPALDSDGAGGAIVVWQDGRSTVSYDVYAQHVTATGAVDTAWPVNGRALCSAAQSQLGISIVTDGSAGAIAVWHELRTGANDVYAQRVEAFGRLGSPEPAIASVQDVPFDQGGHVKVSWSASYLDAMPYNEIAEYEVWRSIPPEVAAASLRSGARLATAGGAAARPGERVIRTSVSGAQIIYWEYVGVQPARRFAGYSYNLSTTGDSVAAGNPMTQVMILALDTDGYSMWASAPLSGYSVDNLAPVTPAPFTGTYAAGTATLHWNPNVEADLAGYRLYRGASLVFVPGPGNLVAAVSDTGYADAAGALYVYKLTAVDVHGNESPVATLTPSGTVSVEGGGAPASLAFTAPTPNPARGATTLRFALSRAGAVRLALYDASGRRVRTLVEGAREAGAHAAAWDLRDDAGRAVGAGLYFARLEAEGRTLTRRVMALK